MRYEAGDMVVQNQTSEQPAKLRLDGYDTILLDAHGVFLIIKTFVKPLVSTTGSVSCLTKLKYCSNWCLEVL